MARNRFITTERVRLPLSADEWVEVKRDLNTGEQKLLEAAGLKPPVRVEGELVTPVDWGVYEIERACIFLLGWNLQGANNTPIPYTPDAVRALEPATFRDINNLIFKHVMDRAKEKNESGAMIAPSPELIATSE